MPQDPAEQEPAQPEQVQSEPAEQDLASMPDLAEARGVLEAALLVAGEPVPVAQLAKLFDPPLTSGTVRNLLDEIAREWSSRKVELVQVASGWRFQGKREVQPYLDRLAPDKPARYSRAVMETLAIIAYQQPVTRGDIEAPEARASRASTRERPPGRCSPRAGRSRCSAAASTCSRKASAPTSRSSRPGKATRRAISSTARPRAISIR